MNALTLQLLEFIAARPRHRDELLDAWHTTCPRLSIWEDACIDGLVDGAPDARDIYTLSAKGRALLEANRRAPTVADSGHPARP
jgi:DNA-binding PadR family transcriptional regulator